MTVSASPLVFHSRRHFWLRLAWLCLFLFSTTKLALALPVDYAALGRVCQEAESNCAESDYLTPQQSQVLETAGISLSTYANLALAAKILTTLVWGGIGVIIFFQRSNDWLAFIASGMMIMFISAGLEKPIQASYPGLGMAADMLFNLGNILMFLFIALFPTGRFSPSWMRWYWLGMILFSLVPSKTWYMAPEIANSAISIFWISFLVLGPYSQIHRYRFISNAVERLQTKWVVFGFVAFAGSVLVGVAGSSLVPEQSLVRILYNIFYFSIVTLFIPLSIGFSILRYRLWDIDLVIRRTLQYSVVTAFLGMVYLGGVTLLQSLFVAVSGQQSPAAVVISTLLIAALFNPLRYRLQDLIDRRFYRRKYNAELALAAFAAAARSETDLERLSARLGTTVMETLQPEQVSLWLQPEKERGSRGS